MSIEWLKLSVITTYFRIHESLLPALIKRQNVCTHAHLCAFQHCVPVFWQPEQAEGNLNLKDDT